MNKLKKHSVSKIVQNFHCSKNCSSDLKIFTDSRLQPRIKVIYPKYSKHWPYTLAHTIDCVCSKMLNHGLNHGLVISFNFQVFWMKIHSKLNKFRIKKNRLLYCFRSRVFTWNTNYSARNQPILICPNGCAEQLFSNVYSTLAV